MIYQNPKSKKKVRVNAFCKVELIKEVINEGWEEDWNNHSQSKFYPWFNFASHGGFGFDDSFGYSCDFSSAVALYLIISIYFTLPIGRKLNN